MKKLITLNIQYYESVATKATLIPHTEISRGIFLGVRAMLDDNVMTPNNIRLISFLGCHPAMS